MKIKHWSGYGCVNGRKIEDIGDHIDVLITGNHEQGLEPRYFNGRDWERWLGKRYHISDIYCYETVTRWNDKTHEDEMIVRLFYNRRTK